MCFLHGWIHWMCNNNWVSSHGWSPFGDLSAVTCQDGFFHKCTFFKFACLLSIPWLSKGQHVNFLHSYIWLVLKIRLLWFSEVYLMGKAFWQLLPLQSSYLFVFVVFFFFFPLFLITEPFFQASSIYTPFFCSCLPKQQAVPKLMNSNEQAPWSLRAANTLSQLSSQPLSKDKH